MRLITSEELIENFELAITGWLSYVSSADHRERGWRVRSKSSLVIVALCEQDSPQMAGLVFKCI